MTGADLAAGLVARGFDFFTGVPCSLIETVITALERDDVRPYLPAVREDAAVGLAAGAYLGGRRPVVLMQNSGLGTSLNALASLSLLYRLPVLLVVTWRGHGGKDAPEHLLTGAITPALLDLLGVPHRVLGHEAADAGLDWAAHTMSARSAPVALVVPPGAIDAPAAHGRAGGAPARPPAPPLPAEHVARATSDADERLAPTMSRRDAIAAVVERLGDEAVVHANGFICRESFAVRDRRENFYMIGSMGLASSIGLGVALAWWPPPVRAASCISSSTTRCTARRGTRRPCRAACASITWRGRPGTERAWRWRTGPRSSTPSPRRGGATAPISFW